MPNTPNQQVVTANALADSNVACLSHTNSWGRDIALRICAAAAIAAL